MTTELRSTGIGPIGDVPWGMHIGLFYETTDDLVDAVVPYVAAGLLAGERCIWALSTPSLEKTAADRLRSLVPEFDRRVEHGDLRFLTLAEFYLTDGRFDVEALIRRWRDWDDQATATGVPGLRMSGNLGLVKAADRPPLLRFEQRLHEFLFARRMLVLCTYELRNASACDALDLASVHHSVCARRHGQWNVVETPSLAATKADLQRVNTELEGRVAERTAALIVANEGLAREVAERRGIEAELRRKDVYLEQGQRLSHTGSIAWDGKTGEYTFWSAEVFRIYGMPWASSPPKQADVVPRWHPDDRDRVLTARASMLHDPRPAEIEFRILRDGEVRYVHMTVQPVIDETGAVRELMGTQMDVTELKRTAARLARVRRRAREQVLAERFSATLEERTRLARAIHDSLLQGVTGVALQLRALLPRVTEHSPSGVADELRHIVELAEATIRDARQAVWDMRSGSLLQKGLIRALKDDALRALGELPLDFSVSGTPRPLSPDVEDAVYRIAQEAVANAVRHSGASRVSVALSYRARSLRLVVTDDGRGFPLDPAHSTGGRWGLLGMHERADRIGAALAVRSAEGSGTTVELRVKDPGAPQARDGEPSDYRSLGEAS